jgi:hypothetical protein
MLCLELLLLVNKIKMVRAERLTPAMVKPILRLLNEVHHCLLLVCAEPLRTYAALLR